MPQNHLSNENSLSDPRTRFHAAYCVLEEAIAAKAFPGCAFGVLAGGKLQFEAALGRFTYENNAPLAMPQTVFDVASLTKAVATTAATMLLVQRKQLDIDCRLGELLPSFVEGRGANDLARTITLRNLLAHNSGLPGYVKFFRTAQTPEELLSVCLRLQCEAQPEHRAEYSDPGFILLGKAIEAQIGESLDRWCSREIFGPLDLSSTHFKPEVSERPAIPPTEEDRTFRKRRIQGEVQDENAWVLGGVAGHAGLFSNVPDLLRFSSALLDADVECETQRLFEAATIAKFSQRQLPPGSSWALGWDTPSENSTSGRHFSSNTIGHLGYSGCSLWIDLQDQIAVVLLTNRTWPDRSSQLIRQVRPAFHDAIRRAL